MPTAGQGQLGKARDHQVEERAALDAHGKALEYRRTAHLGDDLGQGIEAGAQVRLALDIAAQAEQDWR